MHVEQRIRPYVEAEIAAADREARAGRLPAAFVHLERAHVLGQTATTHHVRVHWLMLKLGWRRREWREIVGQVMRIVGAATKTAAGLYPEGNTGGANVSAFRHMPIPDDLEAILASVRAAR
jgi:hypothetical protein